MLKSFGLVFTVALAAPQATGAQGTESYACQPKRVRIDIGSMPLEDATAAFSKATGCPVSWDVTRVSDVDAGAIATTVTLGRYTPAQALRLMLRNTPFKSKPIKGGFSVYQ